MAPPPKDGPDNVEETSALNAEPVVASGAVFSSLSNEFESCESRVGVSFKLSDGESFNGSFVDSLVPKSEGAPESDAEFQPSPFGREPLDVLGAQSAPRESPPFAGSTFEDADAGGVGRVSSAISIGLITGVAAGGLVVSSLTGASPKAASGSATSVVAIGYDDALEFSVGRSEISAPEESDGSGVGRISSV